MIDPLTVECQVDLRRASRGRQKICAGAVAAPGRVPRITRLMALAIRFDQLIRLGDVVDYADLARLGHVSRAGVTQIMNLLLLAPDIQEQILFLPPVERGHDPIHLAQLQPIAALPEWRKQRRLWKRLVGR